MYLIILCFILLCIAIYFLSLITYIIANLKNNKLYKNSSPVSVIVAVKNGEKSLPRLIIDLQNQIYKDKYECVIVDDQSTDNTKKIIQEIAKNDDRFHYVSSLEGDPKLSLKKRALDAGIKYSHFEILLFTDVDCSLKNRWITSMMQSFKDDTDYVIGVAKISIPKNIISIFQKIDLMMMQIIGRATCNIDIPFASIGQNQAYIKKLYNQIGFTKITDSIQGDDTLFMQLCKKNNAQIRFNDDPESFVESRMETKLFTFLKQRIRWSADAKVMWNYNKIFFMILISTFISNLTLWIIPIVSILNPQSALPYFYVLFLVKLILELTLYIVGSIKMKSHINIFYFLFWFVLEMPYVVLMGIGSFFIKYIGWKGEISK
ncbi:glycosyltransferase [Candidatus Marinimicrobia bacterium]|nr:glycosyltransferase [Candidatus Neomarinimicrobiota bacterium]